MRIFAGLALALFGVASVTGVNAQTVVNGPVTSHTPQQSQGGIPSTIDFQNAIPVPMPKAAIRPQKSLKPVAPQGKPQPGYSPGEPGTGKQSPVQLLAPKSQSSQQSSQLSPVQPQEYGTSEHVFATSRVNPSGNQTMVTYFPYRAAGKLFFNIGASTYVCSASLIKRGVIVTAAHCVANFGQNQWYTNHVFVPAYNSGTAPYGYFAAKMIVALTAYLDGTDTCAVPGVVCESDIAVIATTFQNGALPGTATGWFGYGWDGYGFNSASEALISQLGYPVALDDGQIMERTDSQSYNAGSSSANNNVIGSLMTGGSSGGPWLVNLGRTPVLSGVSFGTDSQHNTVVGVTSWGYVDSTIKEQGASPFTSANIGALISSVCGTYPGRCQ